MLCLLLSYTDTANFLNVQVKTLNVFIYQVLKIAIQHICYLELFVGIFTENKYISRRKFLLIKNSVDLSEFPTLFVN